MGLRSARTNHFSLAWDRHGEKINAFKEIDEQNEDNKCGRILAKQEKKKLQVEKYEKRKKTELKEKSQKNTF